MSSVVKKVENFDGAVMSLRDMLTNSLAARFAVDDDEKIGDAATRTAFFTSQGALWKLWFGWDSPRLRALRDKVRIGLIKDTINYGNTSVSMGASRYLFTMVAARKICIFNCGPGPAKAQVYEVADGVHRLVVEVKHASFSINTLES